MYYLLTFLSGGLGGSILTIIYNKIRNRIQWMSCCYTYSDSLPNIPLHGMNEAKSEQLSYKTFVVKNTTNRDYSQIKLNFEFDSQLNIKECICVTSDLFNKNPVKISDNIATVAIDDFNRGDDIAYTFVLTSECDSDVYRVTVSGVTGVKVQYEDKRLEILKNGRSNTLVINK